MAGVTPRPRNEADRLAELRALGVLDTPTEAVFDALARLAAFICDTPISLVTLIDENRQWFKAEQASTCERSTATSRSAPTP